MALKCLQGKNLCCEALNTDRVCEGKLTQHWRELFLQLVYGRTHSAPFADELLQVGAGVLRILARALRSQVGTLYAYKGKRCSLTWRRQEGLGVTGLALDENDELSVNQFVSLGKNALTLSSNGDDPNLCMGTGTKGQYGRGRQMPFTTSRPAERE